MCLYQTVCHGNHRGFSIVLHNLRESVRKWSLEVNWMLLGNGNHLVIRYSRNLGNELVEIA